MPPHHHTLPVPAIPPTSKKSAPHGPAIIRIRPSQPPRVLGRSQHFDTTRNTAVDCGPIAVPLLAGGLTPGMSWLQASGREYSPTWRNPAVPRSPSKLQGGPVALNATLVDSDSFDSNKLHAVHSHVTEKMPLWLQSLLTTWSVGYYRSRSPQAFRMDDAPSTHPSRCAFPCIESVET
ncbi:predicted protein [Plenodomus lingam JN3]|uniref:Predicted protein n=1 Tax=Leptosphaeria maculans (strain JN3 / isolate v23.1.3 / race Av1-4-5-6-7-8) TaxID=985895 RepID=E5ACP4_LEPMJ|nr:predicted protein [Plenodomus lingam JN3]CBY02246.1 predicted protein [Plenodomus lingam JN3]